MSTGKTADQAPRQRDRKTRIGDLVANHAAVQKSPERLKAMFLFSFWEFIVALGTRCSIGTCRHDS